MNDLKYRQPDESDRAALLALSRGAVGMTDVYTYIRLHPDLPQDSRLWIGENGTIGCVFYDDGSYFTVNDLWGGSFTAVLSAKGTSLFKAPEEKYRLTVMEYTGEAFPAEEITLPLTGKEILGVLRLMSGTDTLPDHLERRYVDIVRGVNAGLCAYRGIYENGALVSCGGIVASNDNYALIGNIITRKDRRKNGLASTVVKTLVNEAKKRDLIPILYCERETTGFYRKLGFFETER